MAEAENHPVQVLVIGYGNPLRRDDGLGPFIVETLAADLRASVDVLTSVQLLPELAASLAEVEAVIFVDARVGGEEVELTLLDDEDALEWSWHTVNPRSLLALTRAVYGRSPQAWWVTAPGVDFGSGEGLSPLARENARAAREHIEGLLRSEKLA